jgi:Zinc carboxypeptidase
MESNYKQAQHIADELFGTHSNFKESALNNRRFTHSDILPLYQKLKNNKLFEITALGESVEKRAIFQIKMGTGPIKVLLWSQMHGDEATATMAIFDIFNFFVDNSILKAEKQEILKNCTLYFVPMLNPDGAQRFIRRNALGIDLNRDAISLVSPEAIILKRLQCDLKPDFGFNLHDMMPRYSAGNTGNLATMAFLATAYNEAKEINLVRKKSMQLIVGMNRILQNIIPNQIGRWPDDFEPRAFGDNFQKWGTTLILIESGGYKNDPEKQFIRKLNYVAILSSLFAIATKSFESEKIEEYLNIPENGKAIFDLLIKNATITIEGVKIKADIGINQEEVKDNSASKFTLNAIIADFGDLSTFFGTTEIDASDMEVISENPLELDGEASFKLLKAGKLMYEIKNGKI